MFWLVREWNTDESSESKIDIVKDSPRHWSKIVPELREQAEIRVYEKKQNEYKRGKQLDPNKVLHEDDVRELTQFDSSIIKQGLHELNVEIFKRIVRESYPHKFA